VLGSQVLQATLGALRKCIASFQAQAELAAATDFPPGKFLAANPSVDLPGPG
jgi:hypothetical protein